MQTVEVTLGGQVYDVRRLPAMRAIAWRKRAQGVLERFPALVEAYNANSANMVDAALDAFRAANGVVEELVDVVLEGSAVLQADREHILECAFEEEFMEGLQRLMLLNAPLSGLATVPAQ